MTTDLLSGGTGPALLAIIVLAYFIRGLSGFGSGIIAIPLLTLYLPLQVAVPGIALLDNVAAAKHGLENRQHVVWKDLIPFIPVTLIGVLGGLYLLRTVETEVLQKAMGGFLLLYAAYMISGLLPRRKRSLFLALPIGTAGGLVSTLLGTGGPFYVIYLHLRNQGKMEFRATVAVIFVVDGAIRLSGYLLSGMVSTTMLLSAAAALPFALAGMYAGSRLHHRLRQEHVERLVSLLLAGSGAVLLFR